MQYVRNTASIRPSVTAPVDLKLPARSGNPSITDDAANILRLSLHKLCSGVIIDKKAHWNLAGAIKAVLKAFGCDPSPADIPLPASNAPALVELDRALRELRRSHPKIKTQESRARAAMRTAGVDLPNGWGRHQLNREWEDFRSKVGDSIFHRLGDFPGWASNRDLSPRSLSRQHFDAFELEKREGRKPKGARQGYLKIVAACRDAMTRVGWSIPADWPKPYEGDFRYAATRLQCSRAFLDALDEATKRIASLSWKPRASNRREVIEGDLLRLTGAFCKITASDPGALSSLEFLLDTKTAKRALDWIKERRGSEQSAYMAARTLRMLQESHSTFDVAAHTEARQIQADLSVGSPTSLSDKRDGILLTYKDPKSARELLLLPATLFSEGARASSQATMRTALALELALRYALTVDQLATLKLQRGTTRPAEDNAISRDAAGRWIISVSKTRRSAPRKFLIEGSTLQMLEAYMDAMPPQERDEFHYVFPGRKGGHVHTTTLSRAIQEALKRAPFAFQPHDLSTATAAMLMGAGKLEQEKVRIFLGRNFNAKDPILSAIKDRHDLLEMEQRTRSRRG